MSDLDLSNFDLSNHPKLTHLNCGSQALMFKFWLSRDATRTNNLPAWDKIIKVFVENNDIIIDEDSSEETPEEISLIELA
jgi:hypothetical protein